MNIEPFLAASLIIQIHALSAIAAMILGCLLFILPRGRRLHRIAGRLCASLLTVAAITAVFITDPSRGHWSWIHVTIPITGFVMTWLIYSLRRHIWRWHRWAGRVMVVGTLIAPFIVAISLPDRLMHTVLFG